MHTVEFHLCRKFSDETVCMSWGLMMVEPSKQGFDILCWHVCCQFSDSGGTWTVSCLTFPSLQWRATSHLAWRWPLMWTFTPRLSAKTSDTMWVFRCCCWGIFLSTMELLTKKQKKAQKNLLSIFWLKVFPPWFHVNEPLIGTSHLLKPLFF